MARFNEECTGVSNLTILLAIMALLKGTKDEYFQWSFLKDEPKAMTKVRFRVERYINFKETLQVVDDLYLTNLGVVAMANSTPSSAQDEFRTGKRSTIEERDTSKRPRYDNLPSRVPRSRPPPNEYKTSTPWSRKRPQKKGLKMKIEVRCIPKDKMEKHSLTYRMWQSKKNSLFDITLPRTNTFTFRNINEKEEFVGPRVHP